MMWRDSPKPEHVEAPTAEVVEDLVSKSVSPPLDLIEQLTFAVQMPHHCKGSFLKFQELGFKVIFFRYYIQKSILYAYIAHTFIYSPWNQCTKEISYITTGNPELDEDFEVNLVSVTESPLLFGENTD